MQVQFNIANLNSTADRARSAAVTAAFDVVSALTKVSCFPALSLPLLLLSMTYFRLLNLYLTGTVCAQYDVAITRRSIAMQEKSREKKI